MQRPAVVLALATTLTSLASCERDRAQPSAPPAASAASPPSPAPSPPARRLAPPPTARPAPPRDVARSGASVQPPAPRPRAADVASGSLPVPPSLEPRAYAAWLRALPAAEQRQIAAFCRRHRTDFQDTCGGIGPLHVPYPPYPRLPAGGGPGAEVRRSRFASVEEWSASLTRAQQAYVARACQGAEDQPSSDLCGENTPLVLAFAGEAIAFGEGAAFAFQPGAPTATDWPTATTPWLALDRDHDGAIASGAELFGSDTVLADGRTAPHGFAALAALDHNRDGRIDAADPAFAHLVLWSDRDGDQRSRPDELRPLARDIVSLSLAYERVPRCDDRGNCEGERAAFTWRDPRGALRLGAIVDVYLPRR